MKICCFFLLLFLSVQLVPAQPGPLKLSKVKPDTSDFFNIHVQPLHSDSNSSSYLIWIKQTVPLHLHRHHSEHVYILKGRCRFELDFKVYEAKAGDYFYIPENTVHGCWVTKGPLQVLSIQSPEFLGKDRVIID